MRPRHKWLSAACRALVLAAVLFAPTAAMARSEDVEPDIIDARLEGYTGATSLPDTSSGLSWFIFAILGTFAAGGLFKDAKRSHLD